MSRAPITVPIWETSVTPISLQRAPITVPVWTLPTVPSNAPHQHLHLDATRTADIIKELCRAVRLPTMTGLAYYVGLWEGLHDSHWNNMRVRGTIELAPCWLEFVKAKFGDSTDAVLKMIYQDHVDVVRSSSDWKLLIRYDRVRNCLRLSRPAMFLYLGLEVATSIEARKVVLKLVDNPIPPNLSGTEIVAAIYQLMMHYNERSETPTHPALRDVQGAKAVFLRHHSLVFQGVIQDE
ncbi:hypothetical protein CSAL01_13519 [Colletotrichum salicis]|uniref:Uncharacterized protein n=1 Tax=Colletotrichum salicis TaxID=1209931 RepID=A0A135V812_9PEZI|nr:hypothetical protein CSAL01_13519 [Colletotrichum salicis]